jgi:predicted phosphate transport protein (TIGR00153 family)
MAGQNIPRSFEYHEDIQYISVPAEYLSFQRSILMRLDRFIQVLLPHDEKFYSFFEESAQNLVNGTEALKRLGNATDAERPKIVEEIHELEHLGDSVTHKIFAELNSTFVTPFDREDIHVLASKLDDVMDFIDGTAGRFVLYKLKNCPQEMKHLIDILHWSVGELKQGVALVRDLRKADQLQRVLEKVNEYENDADSVFEQAIAHLFEIEKDPVQIMKIKEIYVSLETATDKCEDAANVLESILIKHG